MLSDLSDYGRTLAHVFWIGGPPDAGKSTVAELLGAQYGLTVYHFDRHEMDHIARADPERHPQLHRLGAKLAEIGEMAWLEEEWIRAGPEEMARRAIAVWTERVGLACGDLAALQADRPIVAEGPGFFPRAILPLLSSAREAIFLVPTEAFKRESHERRGKSRGRGERTSDPARYRNNHIARDLLMAEQYRQEVRESGLRSITIDGTRSAPEVADMVAEHFGLKSRDQTEEAGAC